MSHELDGPSDEPAALPHPPACLCCYHFAVDLEAVYRDSGDERGRGRRARRRQLAFAGAAETPFLS